MLNVKHLNSFLGRVILTRLLVGVVICLVNLSNKSTVSVWQCSHVKIWGKVPIICYPLYWGKYGQISEGIVDRECNLFPENESVHFQSTSSVYQKYKHGYVISKGKQNYLDVKLGLIWKLTSSISWNYLILGRAEQIERKLGDTSGCDI